MSRRSLIVVALLVAVVAVAAAVWVSRSPSGRISESSVASAFRGQGIELVAVRSSQETIFERRDAAHDPLALRVLVLHSSKQARQVAKADQVAAQNRRTTPGPVVSPRTVKNVVIEYHENAGGAARVTAAVNRLG